MVYSCCFDKTPSVPEEARDGPSRESGVSWRRIFSQLTAWATLETRGFRGFKSSAKTGVLPVRSVPTAGGIPGSRSAPNLAV